MPEACNEHYKLDYLMSLDARKGLDESKMKLYQCFHNIYELRLNKCIKRYALAVEDQQEIPEWCMPGPRCSIENIHQKIHEAHDVHHKNCVVKQCRHHLNRRD